MAITPDFQKAAYNINCILNGLQHQWCDGEETGPAAYPSALATLRNDLLPYLQSVNAPLGRALGDALQAVDDGKPTATAIVQEALTRISADMPDIAAHRVDFATYSGTLSSNRGQAYVGGKMRDPNLRVA
ncbi:MAG: hypothetical protein KKA05_06645 [Alphaproteobacteria bacterium]|nr:hypothetical protein [Alphaproteobacteria bacterium]